ncbi:hypothetical protein JW711_01140 [Candidatus Woesearchaeota archaeon]|nr:hypothetical protein [Candidatus Woesearchaeota archaeon]
MKGLRPKRGQNANMAAVVVILIAVMIILYLLFLPPEERANILGEDNYGSGGQGDISVNTLLMSKVPGRIYPSGRNMVEHQMPSFLVFTATNANELKRVDSLYVKQSAFGSKNGEVIFYYDESTMKDVKLSFNVLKHEGMLRITLNDKEVFYGEIKEGSPPPITLPSEALQSRNHLVLEASSPGIIFWKINEYSLESLVISGTVTDYSGARSEQHFSVSAMEYEKFEKAQLEFLPDCPPREGGQLQVLLNGRPVYTSYPDCGIKATIEISKDYLREGDNVLVALTNTGSFLMDVPKLTTFMKESPQPVFYFTVPPTLMEAIYMGRRGLLLSMRFADSNTIKRGTVTLNGFNLYFETQDYLFQTPLDPESILDGSNGIKIIPVSDTLDVVELRVDVV